MILKTGTPLFRYCIGKDLPHRWSQNFHNPEYVNSVMGYKNRSMGHFAG